MITRDEMIAFERDVADAFNAGRIRAPVHLSGGCEDQLRAIFSKVRDIDWVFGSWRSHYLCLLKGVPRTLLMTDILAGKSITLCYPDYRVLTSAIVGGHLPIAVGVALGIKRRGGRERVYAFCGDMAARTGIFHECLQYARGHDLPIRFVVENNGLSVCSNTAETWGEEKTWHGEVITFDYQLPYPHAGAGVRVQF